MTVSLHGQVAQTSRRLLPVTSVERLDRKGRHGRAIDAACVDAEAVRVGSRHVKRFYPAGAAEQMAGDTGIEGVLDQVLLTAQQTEAAGRHDQMPIPAHRTDRAVTFLDHQRGRCVHRERHRAAMAVSVVGDQSAGRHLRTLLLVPRAVRRSRPPVGGPDV